MEPILSPWARRCPAGRCPRSRPRGSSPRYAPHMPTSRIPVAIVGGGTMAQAIVRGGVDAGVRAPPLVGIVEPDSVRRDVFRAWGVRAVKKPEELAAWLASADSEEYPGQILLAVKPQSLPEIGHQFRPLL